jgi:hypothetical protein
MISVEWLTDLQRSYPKLTWYVESTCPEVTVIEAEFGCARLRIIGVDDFTASISSREGWRIGVNQRESATVQLALEGLIEVMGDVTRVHNALLEALDYLEVEDS